MNNDPPQQIIEDILNNLNTPAPQSQISGLMGQQEGNNMLKRIKLELYTGETNITPRLGKLQTLANINGLNADFAKIAFAHLHLAGRALDWINEKGTASFGTFSKLEEALLKEYGLTEGRRQRYRGELLTMAQKDRSVQDITELFENTWRLAYPTEHDSNYKLHNYLRVLTPQLGAQVGMTNPKGFQGAKEMAYQIEAYMPKIPVARFNAMDSASMDAYDMGLVNQIINATQQANQAAIQQALSALSAVTNSIEVARKEDQLRRDRDLEEMAQVFKRERTNDMADIKQTLNRLELIRDNASSKLTWCQ